MKAQLGGKLSTFTVPGLHVFAILSSNTGLPEIGVEAVDG